jgi:ABC-type uncharacterized transport system substrate-binding protein
MSRLYLAVFILIWIIVGCSPAATPTPVASPEATAAASSKRDPIRILRLDSNHAEFAWSGEIKRGVLDGLKANGYEVDETNVILDERYLDTKRKTTEEDFNRASEETIAYIRETKPDLVIVNDDNATRLVVQPMRNDGVKFVLLGLNGTPERYELTDSPNVAGVLERPHASEMMVWIEQVFGEGARISILAEDSLTTEQMFADGSIKAAIEATSAKYVDMMQTSDYAAWQAYVADAADTSDVLFLGAYSTLRGTNGEVIEPLAALQWTLENSKIPVMGFWEEAVHVGTLGGPIISGYTQGYEAAERAARILDGTAPQEIGFSAPSRGKLMVNRHAIEQWSVEVPLDLLEVSEIIE